MRLTGVRGMIASKMQASLTEAAQLTYCADLDATALVTFRSKWNETASEKAGYEDIILHTLAGVLKAHPTLNGTIKDGAAHLNSDIHVSVAVDVKTGLVAPTLFNLQDSDISDIAVRRRDILKRAAAGKLTVQEMTGGSFTISNLGLTRVQYFTPILNAPQIAMLGLGRIEMKPAVNTAGEVVARPVMGVSLTADHRIVDGAPAGRFLTDFCHAMEALS